mmetsp:Transcript_24149/g.70854  ORF Transcript_24149/g.70854 Transcript_24149/m.70854 type:complete len:358 (-) Transcript_24149:95-1168(-)
MLLIAGALELPGSDNTSRLVGRQGGSCSPRQVSCRWRLSLRQWLRGSTRQILSRRRPSCCASLGQMEAWTRDSLHRTGSSSAVPAAYLKQRPMPVCVSVDQPLLWPGSSTEPRPNSRRLWRSCTTTTATTTAQHLSLSCTPFAGPGPGGPPRPATRSLQPCWRCSLVCRANRAWSRWGTTWAWSVGASVSSGPWRPSGQRRPPRSLQHPLRPITSSSSPMTTATTTHWTSLEANGTSGRIHGAAPCGKALRRARWPSRSRVHSEWEDRVRTAPRRKRRGCFTEPSVALSRACVSTSCHHERIALQGAMVKALDRRLRRAPMGSPVLVSATERRPLEESQTPLPLLQSMEISPRGLAT